MFYVKLHFTQPVISNKPLYISKGAHQMLIFTKKFWTLFTLSMVFSLVFCVEVQAQDLTDFKGHWAEKAISTLAEKGVVNGYPDGTFKPDQAITRAEFAKLVSKTFGYTATTQAKFDDVSSEYWASGFINAVSEKKIMNAFSDGNFKPDQTMNRAQVATMISRILNMDKKEENYGEWAASFTDVPADHWAFRYIEIAKKLQLLPSSYQTQFHPDYAVTRAEAAWMIEALSKISVTKGKIVAVDPDTGLVNIQGANNGEPLLSMIVPETIVIRNNTVSSVDALLAGDEATVIALSSGDAKFVKAYGEITKNDLLSRLSSMTKGKLTPNHISAILAGDWDAIKDDIKGGLYNQMIELGLTPAEAESIMVQDWSYLDTLSRDRLSQGLSSYLGITTDLSQALIERDIEKIKECGKIELATAALSRLLGVADAK